MFAVLTLTAFCRIGVVAQYGENGLTAAAAVGPVRIRLLPRREKAAAQKEKGKKTVETAVKAGRLESLRNQLPSLNKAIARLRRKLLIRELTIHYMAAGADPAQTALYFGGVSAGYGFLLPLLENNFRIKKRDLRAAVSFEAAEPFIYVRAHISLMVWEAVYIGAGLVKNMLKSEKMRGKIRKAV
jgi:hypothetical protein